MALKTGVIGPAGFGGSYLTIELLSRGHAVRGISRNPQKLGKHHDYSLYPIDIEGCSIEKLIEAFSGLDVLVNEYGPHSSGETALQYQPFIELTRKIIIAAKEAKVGYFIMVGGCGSLNLPGDRLKTCSESKEWWLSYRRGIADSEAHVTYMEERLGSLGSALRNYRNARLQLRAGRQDGATLQVIQDYEEAVLQSDKALTFVTACRTSYMFFNGNTSFLWTFVSPSALYRPGKRTGCYEVIFDELPVKPAQSPDSSQSFDGRLHGISVADLAIAIADEAERKEKVWTHWSAFADLSDDTPAVSYVTL
ncbi:putative NAD(P)-binding domain-containing protein [Seiridium cardinale]